MTLDLSTKTYLRQKVFVLPYYGHGWHRRDVDAPPQSRKDMIGPEPFSMEVESFVLWEDKIVGVAGKIADPSHIFSGYWCVACLRMRGEFNFRSKPGQYMLWIARQRPHVSPASERAIYEWVTMDTTSPCLSGYGTVAESPDHVQELLDRTLNTRKVIMEQEGGSA